MKRATPLRSVSPRCLQKKDVLPNSHLFVFVRRCNRNAAGKWQQTSIETSFANKGNEYVMHAARSSGFCTWSENEVTWVSMSPVALLTVVVFVLIPLACCLPPNLNVVCFVHPRARAPLTSAACVLIWPLRATFHRRERQQKREQQQKHQEQHKHYVPTLKLESIPSVTTSTTTVTSAGLGSADLAAAVSGGRYLAVILPPIGTWHESRPIRLPITSTSVRTSLLFRSSSPTDGTRFSLFQPRCTQLAVGLWCLLVIRNHIHVEGACCTVPRKQVLHDRITMPLASG